MSKYYHVKTSSSSIETHLHLSHLWHYWSAYEYSLEGLEDLIQEICNKLAMAKEMHEPQLVTREGDMFFVCHADGTFDLCMPVKQFEFAPLET